MSSVGYSGPERSSDNREAIARADDAIRVAQEAKQQASDAKHHVERHEDRCEERWKAAIATMERIERNVCGLADEIKDIGKRVQSNQERSGNFISKDWIIGGGGALIAGMFGVIWYLVQKVGSM